jgi:anti-sigma B factor antagonist
MVISGSGCRFQVVSGVAVVTAPAEIDIASASHLRTALLQAAIDGHATVVVDMTHTQLCDSAGLNLLVRVHKRSLAKGGELRLVLHDGTAVRRIFAVTGIDRVIPHFVSLPDALVADTRACEQCDAVFVPQREHARFCSASCRADWNREHLGDPAVEASALQWSLTAMSEATGRLAGMSVQDRPRALAVAGEAVWWITMVDATLVRHHPEIWEAALVARGLAERRLIDGTLAGLRFVRNRIGREAGRGADRVRGPGQRSRVRHRLGMEAGPGTRDRFPAAPRAAVGDDSLSRLPLSPGRPHHRRNLRAGGGVPDAHRGERGLQPRQQHWCPALKMVSSGQQRPAPSARRPLGSEGLWRQARRT